MLLKPDSSESVYSKLKLKYFAFEQCLVHSKDQFTSLITFLIEMLYFLPTVSIIFRDCSFDQPLLNKFFSFFRWEQFHTHFGVSELLTLSILTVWFFAFLGTIVYTYNLQKPNSFSCRMSVNFLRIIAYFNVPFTAVHLNILLKNYDKPFYTFFKVIMGMSLFLSFLFVLMFLKLKIKPLRKGNPYWSVTNDYEFNRFILNFLRTLVFTIDGIYPVTLVVSAALEYMLRFTITKYYRKSYLEEIETSSNLVIATHLGFLVFTISDGYQIIAQKFLFITWLFCIFKGIYGYYHQLHKPLEFPLCSSSPYEFYDFYYRLSAKYDEKVPNQYQSNEQFYFTTMKEHSRRCKTKGCPLDGVCLMKKNIVNQVQLFISSILKRAKQTRNSPDLQILQEFWKLQGGKKFSFRDKCNDIDLVTQYMIFIVENSEAGKDENALQIHATQISAKLLNNTFLDQLMAILQNFSEFYAELLKSKPKLETITTYGEKMRRKGEEVQETYLDLLKKKAISFKAIEVYIEFELYFLKGNSLNNDLLKKIISIQKNIKTDDIQQIYLPAITVYSESGQVEDANMESVNYLKYNRFELKTKMVREIIYPQFKYDTYLKLSEQQIENSLMFIKKKQGEFACGNIKINTKFLNNKKFYVFIFEKKKKTEGSNFILVGNKDFKLECMLMETEILKQKRHPQIMATVNWREIFQNHIKKLKKELILTKLIKIDLKEYNSILMCSLNRTFNEAYSILSLKIMRNVKETINDRRSIVKRESPNITASLTKFNFIYDLNNEAITKIKGYRKDVNAVREEIRKQNTSCMDPFALQLRTNIVDFTLIKNKNYKQNIKAYRLYGHDLYNIDLEDKDAYVEQFNGMKSHAQDAERQLKKPVDIYIIALVIGVSLVLTALSVFILYSLNTNMGSISQDFIVSSEIDRFKINFYRITAMLRDVALDIYTQVGRDWIPDIMESYELIKLNQNKKMFSNTPLTMTFQQRNYAGNLNELVEVILSEVFTLTKTQNLDVIEDIHDTMILEISDMIENEQDLVSLRMEQSLQHMRSLKNYLGLGIFVGIMFFYILMIYLCYNLVVTVKYNMHELMLTSDHQARQSQENAEKLIYAIDMIRKNFQVDFKNLLFQRRRYRSRRREKDTIVGYNLKLVVVTVIGFFFIVNILIILMFNILIESNFEDFVTMKLHGENILGIYSDLCKETNYIDHTGIVNEEHISYLRNQLLTFEKSVTQLIFSPETNNAILTYFLGDSCQMLTDNNYFKAQTQLTCNQATPNYLIQSPFSIGLHLYLTRIHYNLVENITDAYACTGIYSSIFSKVFSELSLEISTDGQDKLNKFIFEASLYSLFLIAINILYCFSAICLSLYVKKKNQSVEKLIKFLKLKTQLENTRPKIKPQIQSQKSLDPIRKHPKRLSMLEQAKN